MTVVAGIVCCPFIGRHWAGLVPAQCCCGAGGRTPVAVSTVPIVHDGRAYEGGRCGGNPPAQGRAEGPTAQNCSGQWSEAKALALLGDANWLELGRYQRCTKVHPHFGLHPLHRSCFFRLSVGGRIVTADLNDEVSVCTFKEAPRCKTGRVDRPRKHGASFF